MRGWDRRGSFVPDAEQQHLAVHRRDVDVEDPGVVIQLVEVRATRVRPRFRPRGEQLAQLLDGLRWIIPQILNDGRLIQIGRASCRERV